MRLADRTRPLEAVAPLARRSELRAGQLALVLNGPALAFMLFIIAYPLAYALYLTLHRVSLAQLRGGDLPFVGLGNFAAVLADPTFWLSLQHTFVFVIASVALETLLGLGLALIVNEPTRLSRLTRVLLLLPWAIPPIANGLVWSFIFNAKYGYLNVALYHLGLGHDFRSWVGDPALALFTVVAAYVWRTTPFTALLFYASLQGIPEELYEAAEVDGAGRWQRFRDVTLPLLVPTLVVALVLRTTFAFMVFDEILALTNGGPGNATWVAAWYVYRHAFQPPFEIGVGAAAAYVLAAIIAVFAFAYVRLARDSGETRAPATAGR